MRYLILLLALAGCGGGAPARGTFGTASTPNATGYGRVSFVYVYGVPVAYKVSPR